MAAVDFLSVQEDVDSDKIGIIGKTHGVRANNNPNPKKVARTIAMLLFANVYAIWSCSVPKEADFVVFPNVNVNSLDMG